MEVSDEVAIHSKFSIKNKKMKKVIFNADDFGLTKSVNIGILQCFKSGIVTDSSLLMNLEATEDAVKIIKRRELNAGIHLNLTEGKPLSNKVPTLIDKNGNFFNITRFSLRLISNRISERDIEREFAAQIEKFLSNKLTPTHIDTHQYIQMFQKVCKAAVKTAKKYRINKMRHSYEEKSPASIFKYYKKQHLKRLIVSSLSKKSKSIFKKENFIVPDHFSGISTIGYAFPTKSFINILRNLKSGTTEIMCHPGYSNEDLKKISFYSNQRESELRALTSKILKEEIKRLNIKLISFKELNQTP